MAQEQEQANGTTGALQQLVLCSFRDTSTESLEI